MAAFALGLAGDATAVDRLVAALARVRADPFAGGAAEALGRIGDRRAAEAMWPTFVLEGHAPSRKASVTVRGDDPGSADDPWVELRLGLLALAALEDPPGGAKGRSSRPAAPASTGGCRPGWRCDSRTPRWRPVLEGAARSDDAHSKSPRRSWPRGPQGSSPPSTCSRRSCRDSERERGF